VIAGGGKDQRTHGRAIKNSVGGRLIEKSTWRISFQQYIAFQSLSTSQTSVYSLQSGYKVVYSLQRNKKKTNLLKKINDSCLMLVSESKSILKFFSTRQVPEIFLNKSSKNTGMEILEN
jgi:hypothetical protein